MGHNQNSNAHKAPSLDTEKLITDIVPKISESIKNDSVAPGIINEMIDMFGSKNDVKNILKMAHQTNEGFKELKKISAHFFEELCRRIETVPNQEKVQETRNPNSVVRPPIKDQKVKETNSTNNPTTTENTFLREIAKKIDVAMPTIDELKIAQSLKFEDTDKLIKDLFQESTSIMMKEM